MEIANTRNRVSKNVEVDDLVNMNGDEYRVSSETEKSWRLTHTGRNPKAKKIDTYNKNTFLQRFFFNGSSWSFVRKVRVPNFDYI